MLRSVKFYLHRFFFKTQRNHRWVLFFSSVILLIAIIGISQTRFILAMEDQVDPNLPSSIHLKELRNTFKDYSWLGLSVSPSENTKWVPEDLCHTEIWFNKVWLNEPQLTDLMWPFNLRRIAIDDSHISFPLLINSFCDQNTVDLHPLLSSPWQRQIIDPDERRLLFTFKIKPVDEKQRWGSFDLQTTLKMMQSLPAISGLKFEWIGSAAHQAHTWNGMQELNFINGLLILILVLLFRLFFGTWKSGFIYTFTLVYSISLVYGLSQLFDFKMDMLSASLFFLVAVSSLEDFIFVSHSMIKNPNWPFRRHFRELLLPCFFTSLTTIIGFGSLTVSDLQSIRHFGLLAALGSLFEYLAIFFVLPLLARRFILIQSWTSSQKSILLGRELKFLTWVPKPALTLLLSILFLVSPFLGSQLPLTQSPLEMFSNTHPFRKTVTEIAEKRKWQTIVSLVLPEDHPTTEPNLENSLKRALSNSPIVSGVETYASSESILIPQSASNSAKNFIGHRLKESELGKTYFAGDKERWQIYLNTTETEKIQKLNETVNLLCKNKCWLAGDMISFSDFSQRLIHTLFDSLFISLLLVGTLLWWLCRERKLDLFWPLMFSSLWGPTLVIFVMGIIGTTINFVTCIVASILVGITGDNAIQFILARNTRNIEDGIQARGFGSIQCGLMMAICSLSYLLSVFEPSRQLGFLLFIGFLGGLVGDLWLLRGFLQFSLLSPSKFKDRLNP